MTIKVGDTLPPGTLSEFIEVEGNGCSVGPNTFKVEDLTRGKKVVIFGLPGAFTPTCSAQHVPSYLANYDKLKAKGVDEIWCLSVNDAFVMGAWSRDQKAGGKIRFMADGSADYAKKLGLTLDLTARGVFMRGFWVNATNPKGIIFFAAILPQFIDVARPQMLQYAIFASTTFAVDLVIMMAYTALAAKVLAMMRDEKHLRYVNRTLGGAFIAAGLALASFRRAAHI